jgi:hypothetical protein
MLPAGGCTRRACMPLHAGCWLPEASAASQRWWAAAAMLHSFVLVASASLGVAAVTVKQSGPSVDVWAAVDTLHRCGIIDVPDIPCRAFVDSDNVTHMIVGSTGFHQMNGPSILMNGSATRTCEEQWNQTKDPDPAHFAGDEFLDSPIAFPNGTVVALVHTEYPGGVYNTTGPTAPMCFGDAPDGKARNYPYCWTVTVGLAVSHDFGETWAHAKPPPHHLVAAVPYGYNQSQLAYGWGDPSNILKHPNEDYYYAAIWNRNQVLLPFITAPCTDC